MEKKKGRFTGIKIKFLSIYFNHFDGYGIEIMTTGINRSRVITTCYEYTLLGFNLYLNKADEGAVWEFNYNLLFWHFKHKIVRVEPKKFCIYCEVVYESGLHKADGKTYCSDSCMEYDLIP